MLYIASEPSRRSSIISAGNAALTTGSFPAVVDCICPGLTAGMRRNTAANAAISRMLSIYDKRRSITPLLKIDQEERFRWGWGLGNDRYIATRGLRFPCIVGSQSRLSSFLIDSLIAICELARKINFFASRSDVWYTYRTVGKLP